MSMNKWKKLLLSSALSFVLGVSVSYFTYKAFFRQNLLRAPIFNSENQETIRKFRNIYDEYLLRTLDIADLDNAEEAEMKNMVNVLDTINSNELTPVDFKNYHTLQLDILDILNDKKRGEDLILDMRPRINETLEQFIRRSKSEDSTEVYSRHEGKIGTLEDNIKDVGMLSEKELYEITGSDNPDRVETLFLKAIKHMEKQHMDYLEFYKIDKWYPSDTGSLEKELTNRIIIVKGDHPEMQAIYQLDRGLGNIAPKHIEYCIFSPNLQSNYQTSKDTRAYDVLGKSVGSNIILISTKNHYDAPVDPIDIVTTLKHELQHIRQNYLPLFQLKDEKLARIEEMGTAERLTKISKQFRTEYLNLKDVLRTVDHLESPKFRDAFAGLYPVNIVQSWTLLTNHMSYELMQDVKSVLDDSKKDQEIGSALRCSMIAKDSLKKDWKKESELFRVYNEGDHLDKINANQALAWLFPEKYEMINFDILMKKIRRLPDIPYPTRMYTEKLSEQDDERQRWKYVESQSLHIEELLDKYVGRKITDDMIQSELKIKNKKWLYTPTAIGMNGAMHYISSRGYPLRIKDIIQAHNIIAENSCVDDLEAAISYRVMEELNGWKYLENRVVENGRVINEGGGDHSYYRHLVMVYGPSDIIWKIDTDDSIGRFWEFKDKNIKSIHLKIPYSGFFPTIQKCQRWVKHFDHEMPYYDSQERYILLKKEK